MCTLENKAGSHDPQAAESPGKQDNFFRKRYPGLPVGGRMSRQLETVAGLLVQGLKEAGGSWAGAALSGCSSWTALQQDIPH